jgi:hypothetical protein
MAELGDSIEIDSIIGGARSIAEINTHIPAMDILTQLMPYDLLSPLAEVCRKTIPKPGPVAVFGDIFLGSPTSLTDSYTEPVKGREASIVGCLRGLGTVYLTEPVVLSDGIETHAVPALSFNVLDVRLENADISVTTGQRYARLAVPLLGQQVSVFKVFGVVLDDKLHRN